MKHIHVPTFIILGVSIFCASVASFDMANAIRKEFRVTRGTV